MYLEYLTKNFFNKQILFVGKKVESEEEAENILKQVDLDNNIIIWGATLWKDADKDFAIKDLR